MAWVAIPDTSCPASLQGAHRLERGRRYYEYLGHLFGPDVYDTKFIELVPDVGHDGRGLYTSGQGKAVLFIDAESAVAAVTVGYGRQGALALRLLLTCDQYCRPAGPLAVRQLVRIPGQMPQAQPTSKASLVAKRTADPEG